ncbi:MAG: hypothetical protein IJ945_06175 [Oscillospiraceae bacterium]|nr:hypothetical protein [Oscillospiraceae bacterium]
MKKIISMILALVMVFAIGVTAFASTADVGSLPSHDHNWDDWEEYDDRWERTCEECGVTEIIYKDGVDEENPETGAASAFGMIALVSAAAVSAFKRK